MKSSDSQFTTTRVEAFSDGVLAIAITLLVLEIRVPHLESPVDVPATLSALLALSPKLAGFLLSFLFIAVFWVNHHRFFGLIRRVDAGLLWLNNLLLFLLCFIPFPTAFMGDYPNNPVTIGLFALVLVLAGLAFNGMWRHALTHRLYEEHVAPEMVQGALRRGLVGPAAYAAAGLLALAWPPAAWVIFLLVPLYYALPSGRRTN